MKLHERAAQIWPLLGLASKNGQILSYGQVGKYWNGSRRTWKVFRANTIILLACLLDQLSALTIIVVNQSGLPGNGFVASSDIRQGQEGVFNTDWLEIKTPSPEELLDAVTKLRSCGNPEAALDVNASNIKFEV